MYNADKVIHELVRLHETRSDLQVALEDCTALYELALGERSSHALPGAGGALRLYDELLAFADEAFHEFNEHWSVSKKLHPSRGNALAACALIGVVRDNWEPDETPLPSATAAGRHKNKGYREDLAGTWVGLSGKRTRERSEELFKSLRNQLRKFAEERTSAQHNQAQGASRLGDPASYADHLGLPLSVKPHNYVNRPKLEHQLSKMLESSADVIVVYGMPSTGKDTLVRHVFADSFPEHTVVRINGHNPDTAASSAYSMLMDAGISYSEIGPSPLHYLRDLIASPRAPHFIHIEGVESDELISLLISERLRSKLVVTGSRRMSNIGHAQLAVRELESDESVRLVQLLLPEASESDASRLAESLGNHPLAITQATSFIKGNGETTVNEFCNNLSRNAAELLDGDARSTSKYLTVLYRRILDDLATNDPQSLCLLKMLAFLDETDIDTATVAYVLGVALDIPESDTSHRKAIAIRTLTHLAERCLIEPKAHGEIHYCRISKMSHAIISHLTADDHAALSRDLGEGMLQLAVAAREVLGAPKLTHLMRELAPLVVHLAHTYFEPRHFPIKDHRLYLLAMHRATHAILRALDVEPWRILVLAMEEGLDYFVTRLVELPVELGEAKDPEWSISWNDPEPHEISIRFPGWPQVKEAPLVIVECSTGRHYTAVSKRAYLASIRGSD